MSAFAVSARAVATIKKQNNGAGTRIPYSASFPNYTALTASLSLVIVAAWPARAGAANHNPPLKDVRCKK